MKNVLPALFRDAIGLIGFGGTSYGFWLIYEPLGYIVGGVLLLYASILLSRAGKVER